MKKLLPICFALTVCVNACFPLDFFEPIPEPLCGWTYVQAKNMDGDPLCGLDVFNVGPPHTWAYRGIADPNFVQQFLLAPLEFPREEASITLRIESTHNYWTLKTVENQFKIWSEGWVGLLSSGYDCTFYPVGTEYPNRLVIGRDGVDLLELTWNQNIIDVASIFSIIMPTYSGDLTITKIGEGVFTERMIFVVKAYGFFNIGVGPAYTGFQLVFL